jgi:hypothetical protein
MSYRDINNPKEMLRRLAYSLYLMTFFGAIASTILAIATHRIDALIWTLVLFSLLYLLHYIGFRSLDFSRMEISFPSGCKGDLVRESTRRHVKNLIHEFQCPDTDGYRRQEIRITICQLTQEEPAILHAYGPELECLIPGITAGVDLSYTGFVQH